MSAECGRPDVEVLLAVGGGAALGDWDPSRGLAFERTDDGFQLAASLPPGVVLEYKLVARLTDGTFVWEDRGNRYLLAKPGSTGPMIWGS